MNSAPFEVSALSSFPSRSEWDSSATDRVRVMLDRWQLTPGSALVGGEASSVLNVTTREGAPAVLKVGFPHPEAIWEAVALEAYGPTIAPRVLRQDPWAWSMLLEPVVPGTTLAQSPLPAMERLGIGVAVLRRIAVIRPPDGIPQLREVVGGYLGSAERRLADQRAQLDTLGALAAVEFGLSTAQELIATDRRRAFLHGDFNPHNILRGAAGWRVIDPKPMLGDIEYDVWPLVSQLPASVPLTHRLEATGVDTRRAAQWGVARAALTLSWAVDERAPTNAAVSDLREWTSLLTSL